VGWGVARGWGCRFIAGTRGFGAVAIAGLYSCTVGVVLLLGFFAV